MTSLQISEKDIPSLEGKTAIVTGGASGIGFAAVKILASKGAKVFILDLGTPDEPLPVLTEYIKCDITSWAQLSSAFKHAGNVNIAIANAGVSEETDYFKDTFDTDGALVEPKYAVLDVNLRGVLNFVKLSLSQMRQSKTKGSIVITSSATAYAPEQSLPVYSAGKLALIGLVRAMRSALLKEDITINAVAPAATITKLLPAELAAPIIAASLPVSTADHVGLAVVYSAVASENRRAEVYGKDTEEVVNRGGRWSGRTILTLGDTWTELEEPIASLRPQWFGMENMRLTRLQQSATDFRT